MLKKSNDRKMKVKKWLTKEGNNFCILPYRHLAIEANGDLRPCCQGEPLLERDGSTVNIKNYNSISELWEHPSRKEMILAFDSNKQFKNCIKCWKDQTEFSPRINFSTAQKILSTTELVIDRKEKSLPVDSSLEWLEIKFGNKCNLKCRICGLINSSSWAKDDFNLKNESSEKNYHGSSQEKYNKDCLWIENENLYTRINSFQDIKTIHIMGGEPLMVPEHFVLLENLSQKYDMSGVTVCYNTNGTIKLHPKHEAVYDAFGKVKWSLSIDDIAARFEYQRKNARWSKAFDVINFYHNLSKDNKNHSCIIDLTVSIYNIFYLTEIIDFYESNNWNYNFFNHFVKTGVNSIRTLSLLQKDKINEFYKKTSCPNVKNVLSFMNSKDLWSSKIELERITTIKRLDYIRSDNFEKTFPLTAQMIF